jgi:hypothetical protein
VTRLSRAVFSLSLLAAIAASAEPQFQQRRGGVQSPVEDRMEKERQKNLNKERQAAMKKDMEKLFQLATELKTGVEKTDENMLSLEVIRKTEEVEKLAKSIRDKMKASYMMPGPEAPFDAERRGLRR